MSKEELKPGVIIKFLRTITEPPCEEHPGLLFANEGDFGTIEDSTSRSGTYSVFWDKWPGAAFYAEIDKDFVVIGDTRAGEQDG
jgi:hypothetical protein